MIEAYEVYKEYLAISRHFTTKNYNYNKYKGQVRVKHETFLKRKDKGLFYKLGYKLKDSEKIRDFFIANFAQKNSFSSYSILDSESLDCYNSWVKRKSSLNDYFYRDIRTLSKLELSVKQIFISQDGALPIIMQLFIQNKICLETVVIFDIFFKFIERNREFCHDGLFDKYALLVSKYKTFIDINRYELKKIIDSNL